MKYRFHTKPYKHQVLALKKLLRNGYGGALLMDPRTGKSKVFIDFASILFLENKIDRVLIVCPPKILELGVWQEQWEQHCPYEHDIFIWDRTARDGGRNGLPEPLKDKLLVVLVNNEAFSRPGKKLASGRRSVATGRTKIRNQIRRWTRKKALLGVDESHNIKSTGSAIHRMVVSLYFDFSYRVIMTGTVVTKQSRPHDIYAQWKIVNRDTFAEWDNISAFRNYFAIWRTNEEVPVPIFVKPREEKLDELHSLMMTDAYSITREECMDLPPRDTQIIPVELKRSARVYDAMAQHMVAEIRQHTAEASIPIVKILRLAQITGGFVTSNKGVITRVGTEKLDILKVLIQQYLDNSEKFAIVARFKPELDAITKLAKTFGVPVFSIRGGMDRTQQYADFKRARKMRDPMIYVLQPHASAEGIDLSFMSRMLWYSLTTSFVKYTQCCDRIALSRVSTTLTYLLTNGIDKLTYDAMQGDGQFLNAIRKAPERLLRDATN